MSRPCPFTPPADAAPDVSPKYRELLRPILRRHLDALEPREAPADLVEWLASLDADAEETTQIRRRSAN